MAVAGMAVQRLVADPECNVSCKNTLKREQFDSSLSAADLLQIRTDSRPPQAVRRPGCGLRGPRLKIERGDVSLPILS
jgi:hypothetical protein